jgi:DNA repair exonuclease SbcCD ATPase subunit
VKIDKLRVKRYGCLKPGVYEFGDRVNLITGNNGNGKTTLCSAVVWGLWGQNTRGVVEPGTDVTLYSEDKELHRAATIQGERVEFTGLKKSNKTRFLETITPLVGEFAAWNRGLWITGSNVNAFSAGSPSSRFAYLSKILGADRYDKTLEKLRDQLKEQKKQLGEANAAIGQMLGIESDWQHASNEAEELKTYGQRFMQMPSRSSTEIAKLRESTSAELSAVNTEYLVNRKELQTVQVQVTTCKVVRAPRRLPSLSPR